MDNKTNWRHPIGQLDGMSNFVSQKNEKNRTDIAQSVGQHDRLIIICVFIVMTLKDKVF